MAAEPRNFVEEHFGKDSLIGCSIKGHIPNRISVTKAMKKGKTYDIKGIIQADWSYDNLGKTISGSP
jgi:hypothetical protein